MKFYIFLIFFAVSTVISVELNDVGYYGSLIKNVHDKCKSAGVILAWAKKDLSFEETTFFHDAMLMLSDEGISTLMIEFGQLKNRLEFYREITNQPLIVIVLDTIEALHSFESIAKNSDMSYGVWLILFSRDAGQDACRFCRQPHGNIFNVKFSSKVLISCCHSSMIEEWWSLEKNYTKTQKIGRLIDGNLKINWFPTKVVRRHRYSMDGRVLRVAATKLPNSFEENDGNHYGVEGEILSEMAQTINFTISKIIWENSYGSWDPETSKWTGVMGRVHRQEADIGFPTFLMTQERLKIVDMTIPIYSGAFQLHVRKLDVAYFAWNAHFKALARDVWIAIIGAILIIPMLLTLIKYKRNSYFFPLLCEQYLKVWGIFCQQSLPDFRGDSSSRIVYISIFISALVVAGAYSAAIISSLAVTSSSSPFTTMEEFVADGTYKLIVIKNTLSYDYFKGSNRPLMKKMISLMKPKDSLPLTVEEGFEQVCNDKVAFYTRFNAKMTLINMIPCEITSIRSNEIGNFALIMPRGSDYLQVVNHHIRHLKYSGIIRRLERTYYTKLEMRQLDHPPVYFQEVATIFMILAIGILCALIIFIIERNSYELPKMFRVKKIRIIKRNSRNFPVQRTIEQYPYTE